jgi:adenylate kinase family enzyme
MDESYPLPISPRIIVVGTSGVGKTTLARTIAERLNLSHIEMDALHWEANCTPAAPELFRERVKTAVSQESWVMDGGYGVVRGLTWGRANLLLWLDYPLPLLLSRLMRRTFRRVATQEELWNGNRESVRLWLFSRDSLLYYVLKTYRRRRRDLARLLSSPEYSSLPHLRFRTPRETEAWLNSVAPESNHAQF